MWMAIESIFLIFIVFSELFSITVLIEKLKDEYEYLDPAISNSKMTRFHL